jgi:hypothetical protein
MYVNILFLIACQWNAFTFFHFNEWNIKMTDVPIMKPSRNSNSATGYTKSIISFIEIGASRTLSPWQLRQEIAVSSPRNNLWLLIMQIARSTCAISERTHTWWYKMSVNRDLEAAEGRYLILGDRLHTGLLSSSLTLFLRIYIFNITFKRRNFATVERKLH